MILQQNTEASLWGWDKPGTTVEVTTSWSGQKYSAKTGKDGKWAIKVQTPKASYTPLSITFDDGEKTTLNNVLAGEVWVCAGQSNMEMPVKGFGNCPVEGYNKAVLEANQYKGVHYVKIPSVMSSKPLDDANCEWKEVNPETRILKQVEIEDARMATEVTSMLMGSDVPPRRAFIHAHANEAQIDA